MVTTTATKETLIPGTNIPMPYTQWMWVDRAMARTWLMSSRGNMRKMNNRWVDYYARLIKAGQWMITHQGIAFNVKGKLEDGQHRLTAIDIAGGRVFMPVSWNLPEAQGVAIDCGLARPLSMRTALNRRTMSFGSFLLRIKYGSQYKVAPDELERIGSYFHVYLKALFAHCNSETPIYSSACFVSAAIMAVVNGEDQKYVFDLYRDLISRKGEARQRDSAIIHAAYTFVRQNDIQPRNGTQMDWFYYVLRFAFQKQNESTDKLKRVSDEAIHKMKDMDLLFIDDALVGKEPLVLTPSKPVEVELVLKSRLEDQVKITKRVLEAQAQNDLTLGRGD